MLYGKTNGAVEVLAVNTLGVLYIVENGGTVQSMADLKGQTIVAAGKGSTPEYALRYLLTENGIDPDKDVTIDWKSEHSEWRRWPPGRRRLPCCLSPLSPWRKTRSRACGWPWT